MKESAARRGRQASVFSSRPGPQIITDPAAWDALVARLPGAHLLQSWTWGEFKRRNQWRPTRLRWETEAGPAAAQVLARTAARAATVLYVPKGPLLAWAHAGARTQVLGALEALARERRAVLIKLDPDVPVSTPAATLPAPGATASPVADGRVQAGGLGQAQPAALGEAVQAELKQRGWVLSAEQVQFRNTVTLDLRASEADLLAGMKQKTRYNLRLAERKGVTARPGSAADLDLLYRMYAETSVRDGFVIRGREYYEDAWGRFMAAGLAQPLIAEVDGAAVSALVVYRFGRTAWYLYGMSRDLHRDKMPNHLLQWRAIQWARAQGCETYDFWGAPDTFDERDKMWGVWKFKEGFGGQVVRHLGAWDYAPSPVLYRLYTRLLPRVLAVMRRRGRQSTRAALEA